MSSRTVQQTLEGAPDHAEVNENEIVCSHCTAKVPKERYPEHIADDCPNVDREVRYE